MKKSFYLKNEDKLSSKIKSTKNGAISFLLLSILSVGIFKIYPNQNFNNQAIVAIQLILALITIIFTVKMIFLQTQTYYDIRLRKKRTALLILLEKLRLFKHQHEKISQKLTTLLRYHHEDKETMSKLDKFLKNANFSYIYYHVDRLLPFPASNETTFSSVIGEDVRELKSHIKLVGWGHYANRLSGSIKLKIYEAEEKNINLIDQKIKAEIALIDSLEN